MAACPFCRANISADARKCRYCHSLLGADAIAAAAGDDDKQKKSATELAKTVIEFVGFSARLIGVVGLIAAGGFAWFGISSFNDLKDDVKRKAAEEFGTLKKDQERLIKDQEHLLQGVRSGWINFSYSRYDQVVNSYILYDINDRVMNDLIQIMKSVQSMKGSLDKSNDLYEKVMEMEAVIQSLEYYRAKDYNASLAKIKSINPDTVAAYRMLCTVNSTLAEVNIERSRAGIAGSAEMAEQFVTALEVCTRSYVRLSPHGELSKFLRATALMRRARLVQVASARDKLYDEAIEQLNAAGQVVRGRSYISYNLAACYVGLKQYAKALKHLSDAKQRGDLLTARDVKYFEEDSDFRDLHKSTDPDIQKTLSQLKVLDN
jgi:tetratricopeptide (TPR) repeat protein